MNNTLQFTNRTKFRNWLDENCQSSAGIWLIFGKKGGPKTLTATEALEEALYFGWIDGQMQSIDDKTYQKYFAPRREKSRWSEKNKTRKTYARAYYNAKTDAGREKRLAWIVDRLNKNLRPMQKYRYTQKILH